MRQDLPVCRRQRVNAHAAVGGAGGRKGDRFHAGLWQDELLIKLLRCASGGEDRRDRRLFQQPADIVGFCLAYAGVRRAADPAGGEHVPQRDAAVEAERALFRNRKRNLR